MVIAPDKSSYASIGRPADVDTQSIPYPAVAKSMTPVEHVTRTLSDARDLSNRVRTIVDGLIGSRPEKEGDPGRGISGGILISLADNAEDTLTELRRAHDELSRLSKVLGLGL